MKIEVELNFFDNPNLPANQIWVASIREGQYRGTVVTSNGPAGCFREISISMAVIDRYRQESASNNPINKP